MIRESFGSGMRKFRIVFDFFDFFFLLRFASAESVLKFVGGHLKLLRVDKDQK